MIRRYVKRFPHPFAGILYALRNDFSYQTQVVIVGVIVILVSYILWPLSQVELLFLGLAYTLILITELQNSSLEEALDTLHPELHEKIRKSKDMAAGATLTAGFFLVFVIAVIVFF